MKASERLEYEEAAKYRDLLGIHCTDAKRITPLSCRIKKTWTCWPWPRGLAKVLVSVLQVRQGKVIDHVKLTLENELELPVGGSRGPFFSASIMSPGCFHPGRGADFTRLGLDPDVETWLSAQKEVNGSIKNAKEAWRLNLMNMAEKNVLAALKEDLDKRTLLKEIQTLIGVEDVFHGIWPVSIFPPFKDPSPWVRRFFSGMEPRKKAVTENSK